MSLAPYCLPIYTYALLMLRPLLDFHGLIIYDILIGITLAFHVVNFKKDTSRHQPDINQYRRGLGGLFPWLQCLHQFLAPAVRTSIQHSRRVWVDFLSITLKSASYLQNMGGHAICRMDE